MPFGFGSLILIAASLVIALAFFVLVKVGASLARKLLPADHPNQQRLAAFSQNSRELALWMVKRIQWFLLFALLVAGAVVTIVYS